LGATPKSPKSPKKFLKCLIFNGLVFWVVFGLVLGFLELLLKTCYNTTNAMHQLLDFQHFANITQVPDFQQFYASLGAGRVGQG